MKACGRIMKDRAESTINSIAREMGEGKTWTAEDCVREYEKNRGRRRDRWRKTEQRRGMKIDSHQQ